LFGAPQLILHGDSYLHIVFIRCQVLQSLASPALPNLHEFRR
jgi:hypothetical protein